MWGMNSEYACSETNIGLGPLHTIKQNQDFLLLLLNRRRKLKWATLCAIRYDEFTCKRLLF